MKTIITTDVVVENRCEWWTGNKVLVHDGLMDTQIFASAVQSTLHTKPHYTSTIN